jgi:hypothetical protein
MERYPRSDIEHGVALGNRTNLTVNVTSFRTYTDV